MIALPRSLVGVLKARSVQFGRIMSGRTASVDVRSFWLLFEVYCLYVRVFLLYKCNVFLPQLAVKVRINCWGGGKCQTFALGSGINSLVFHLKLVCS